MGAASSNTSCCSSGERSPLGEIKSDNEMVFEKKILKLDPRSPTVGIERTPIQVLSFQVPLRETISEAEKVNPMGEDSKVSSECYDSEISSLTKLSSLDPRSPSTNVTRTPVQIKNESSENCGQGFINFSYEKATMDETPVHPISFDPRSPNCEINRTPIQVKESQPLFFDDPRSPSQNVERTPLSCNEKLNQPESLDPRSPLTDKTRTPISAVHGGGNNLRRTVLMSNALMASPATSPNIVNKKLSMDTSESMNSDASVDYSSASLVANLGSPQPSLSSEDEVYLSSDNYTQDSDGPQSPDFFDPPSCDMSWDFGNLDLSDKLLKNIESKEINDLQSLVKTLDDPKTDEAENDDTNAEMLNLEPNNETDDRAKDDEDKNNIVQDAIETDMEFNKTQNKNREAGMVEEKGDTGKVKLVIDEEDSLGAAVTNIPSSAMIKCSYETIEEHKNIEIDAAQKHDIPNRPEITVKIIKPEENLSCVICDKEAKTPADDELIQTPTTAIADDIKDIPFPNKVVRQRQMRTLIPKRSRSSSLENRGDKSPQIITISPNPNRTLLNENTGGSRKPRAWSLSDASVANIKQNKENKSTRLPRQMSVPSAPKSHLKASKAIPRSPLASLNHSNTRQEQRGRSRLSNRSTSSKVPRYQGTPPYAGGNKSLSLSRDSSSSIYAGKEN